MQFWGCLWMPLACCFDPSCCLSSSYGAQRRRRCAASESAFGMSGEMCAYWFGILVVKMAEFCLITPPIGLNCFVVAGVRDDITVQDVFRGVTPFFIADAFTIAGLVAFPGIVLWLPSLA